MNLRNIYFQIADARLLDDDVAQGVKNGEEIDLADILKALVIRARDVESITMSDPQATWTERRLARACLITSFLGALAVAKE